jgi:hypothetical protein
MPITTVLTSENFLNDVSDIWLEFIRTYFTSTELEVTDSEPFLDETTQLTTPILYLESMINTSKSVGMGNVINRTNKGEFENMEFIAWWIVTNDLGGSRKCNELSAKLHNVILNRGFELAVAGIKNPRCTSFRPIGKNGSGAYYGGRQMLIGKILLVY